jgi:hypothetical protein
MDRTGPSAGLRTRVDGLFDGRPSQGLSRRNLGVLDGLLGGVERLRRMPGDSAALGDLLHQVRSVQETSKFLGMSALQASAGLVLESLESASAAPPCLDRSHRPDRRRRAATD